MKIDVVYEKADILRLITLDLRNKGIKVKPGATPAYKGALEVKLSVEAEEDSVTPPSPPVLPSSKETAPAEVDMGDVLNSSRNLAKQPGKFEPGPKRNLGPNESYEYPGDKA